MPKLDMLTPDLSVLVANIHGLLDSRLIPA